MSFVNILFPSTLTIYCALSCESCTLAVLQNCASIHVCKVVNAQLPKEWITFSKL